MTHHRDPSLNALAHGATAETLFIPGENPDDFYRLLDESFAFHQPSTTQDSTLVYDSVHARWHLNRRLRVHSTYEHHLHTQKPDITTWTPDDLHQLNLFDRYKTQIDRAFRRALTNVQAIRREALTQEHWRELLALQKERIHLQREKFELAKAKEARHTTAHAAKQQASQTQSGADVTEQLHQYQATFAPIQHDPALNCSVIVQRSFIRIQDGTTYLDQISPTHYQMRKFIEHRAHFAHPPQLVVRHFAFINDVPEEYEFVLPAGFERTAEARYFLRYDMAFDAYLALADREDILLATQPEPDEDESLISDEDWLTRQRKHAA
jgi:hypothetical protein